MGEVVPLPRQPPRLVAITQVIDIAARAANDLFELRVLMAGLKPGEPIPPIGEQLRTSLLRHAEAMKHIAQRVIDEKPEDFPRNYGLDLH